MPEFWEPKSHRHRTIRDRVWAQLANPRYDDLWARCQGLCADLVWDVVPVRVGSRIVEHVFEEAINA